MHIVSINWHIIRCRACAGLSILLHYSYANGLLSQVTKLCASPFYSNAFAYATANDDDDSIPQVQMTTRRWRDSGCISNWRRRSRFRCHTPVIIYISMCKLLFWLSTFGNIYECEMNARAQYGRASCFELGLRPFSSDGRRRRIILASPLAFVSFVCDANNVCSHFLIWPHTI